MYLVRKKRNEQCFCVKHAQTGDIHSEHATRKAALAQLRQLSVGMPKPTPFAPATLGSGYGGAKGVRGKNLKKGTLFGMPITDSGERIPAPKKRMTLKEFHALEGVPGMHPLYNVFPQGTRAKEVIPNASDLSLFNRETKLMHRDMKLKGRPYQDTFKKHDQPIPDTPLYRAYEATRGKTPSASALRTFQKRRAEIP